MVPYCVTAGQYGIVAGKGEMYEKMWRAYADIQLTVKIWNRRFFKGSL